MRTRTSVSLLILTFFGFSFCIDLNCKFRNETILVEQTYFCVAQNDLNIYDPNTKVSKINGNNLITKSSSFITGLSIDNKKTQYIPSNLGEKFTDLIALRIKNGRLKELVQEDIKSLTKLKYLNLDDNDIENLENDLFEYNKKLELIWFSKNKIKNVGSAVFDNLKSLGNLDLFGNKCITRRASFAGSVLLLLEQVKQNCSKLELNPSNKNKLSEFLEIDYEEILDLKTEKPINTTTIPAPLSTKRVMINRINHQPAQNKDIFEIIKEKDEEDLRNSQKNIQSLQNELHNLNKSNEIESIMQVNQHLWPNLELEKSKQENIKIQNELKLLKNQLDEQVRMANKDKIEYENKMSKSVDLLKKQLNEKEQKVIRLELELKNCKMKNLNRNFKKTIESVEISNEEIEY